MGNYVITLARGLGSGGSHIGHSLAEQLGIKYLDDEILQMAADHSGINESYFWDANERIRKSQVAIEKSAGVYNKNIVYKETDKEYLSNENIFNMQAQVIKNIVFENKMSCVIVGKAANYILRGLKNVVKVNIQAPSEKCIKNLNRRLGIGYDEAKMMIEKTDKYRKDYYKYYTGGSWISPKEYDLSINTGSISEEYATKMIIDLVKSKGLI